MQYRSVVDQIVSASPVDPAMVMVFCAVFAAVALLTAKRPAYGVCALIFVQPFALYRDILGTTITVPKVVLLAVMLGLSAYPGVLSALRSNAARGFLIAALLVVGATALSIAQAASLHPALRETLKIIEYALLFSAAYAAYRLDPDVTLVRYAIAATVSLVAVGALAQEFLGAPSGLKFNDTVIPRIAGALEGPNQLAGYLEIGIAVLAAFQCASPARSTAIALALATFADILTFSRAGLGAAVIALLVVCVAYRQHFTRLVAPLAVGALSGSLLALFWAEVAHSFQIFRLILWQTNYAGGVGNRSELWRAAFALWRTHPIFGVGAGNFELDLPSVGLTGVRTHANSLYLQALAEGGIPLFAATLYLVYTSIATFIRKLESPLAIGAMAASIALAVHQIFDLLIFFPKIGGWWWLVLALAAASITQPHTETAREVSCAT